MSDKYPNEEGWWAATLFRLSGGENEIIRRLIAGNPELPPAGIKALAQDDDWFVLQELFWNPATSAEVKLKILRHPDTWDFADEEFYEAAAQLADLTPQDLEHLLETDMEGVQELAALHPSATLQTLALLRSRYVGDLDGMLGQLLKRFPYSEHQSFWDGWASEAPALLLSHEGLPYDLLHLMAWKLKWQLHQSSDRYDHELTEKLFAHPQADSGIFGEIIWEDSFLEEDRKWDFPCLTAMLRSGKASEEEREFALKWS